MAAGASGQLLHVRGQVLCRPPHTSKSVVCSLAWTTATSQKAKDFYTLYKEVNAEVILEGSFTVEIFDVQAAAKSAWEALKDKHQLNLEPAKEVGRLEHCDADLVEAASWH